ncbi:MAG: Glu/Leu/Phe/Val dehydrogenase [Saprospiraceae bacterium]|nr:Glu/Leu/Phe/Val dehydrogenase [Saprospiraceae bacterium]
MSENLLSGIDHLGPAKVVELYNPKSGLQAMVVIDNIAAGPAIGGIRMAPDVTANEVLRLARAMTLKNAAAGLAHGGGKAIIQADHHQLTMEGKENLIRSFALAIKDLQEYIPGPDMGTDEHCMAWIQDEISRSVGLPREIGGIPLDEIGATGIGLLAAAQTAYDFLGLNLKGAKVAVQGFGAVGKHAARLLVEKGALIVAVADSQGTIYNDEGLEVSQLIDLKNARKSVIDYSGGKTGNLQEIISIPCDIWIPAARPDIIDENNVNLLNTKLIIQGANIPVTEKAEEILFARGIHIIPDFIANAGGVICAAVEFHGGTEQNAIDTIIEKISHNTREVLKKATAENILPRMAANKIAELRLLKAMQFRR